MIDKVNTIVKSGRPFYIHMARNGIYEESWKPNPRKERPSIAEIEAFVGQKNTKMVSIEAFFKTIDGYDLYFGTKYSRDLTKVNGYVDFLDKVCNAVWNSSQPNFKSICETMGKNMTGKRDWLINKKDLDRIVVVLVVNWWKTYGEKKLWERGEEKIISEKILKRKMGDSLPLTSNKNYAGFEIVSVSNPYLVSWCTIQASDKQKGRWIFAEKRVIKLFENLLDFEVRS
ncbi:hypothetical protein A2X44_04355 [candidate division CPR3 bacterium GWF2_35_18]|uniref:Uncharacterized protein n=1 Tax=candidate division CPR3 bacterium GW2011_GWF2_35_18 TaxID=1618350 RepID=A0A0G0BZR3_UNCC3|nr:MAG: hypothetical protein UR67_C0007G0061 [candidate division CPR3 bacterium GW2011_GWF2_35_18]OGB62586.1 MAG: hypothetical protein A2X44_04355 [candidate division CPR3 bacterium GWF2_35_18]OGB65837.1 MAG: hypothetical protein A2250_01605 [candidate division CPR3 bacterium RIFOXYA2_FULL_35_13]OGB77236.1 MAG: hypothetical protein A2476_01595 [candidate division CPR3 bacterium RIFOXYC2_FULL_35_7]OGB78814.1 MAG: hypothetical protein A2296_05115 [candidate division CPR3 bacterium RIFOXYB2_FULL_3